MKKETQIIKCNVESCIYQNDEKNLCTLEAIQVGSSTDEPTDKDETACKSFEYSDEFENKEEE